MRVVRNVLVLSALIGAAACGRESPAADARLAADLQFLDSLSLGLAAEPAARQDVVSAVELGLASAADETAEPVAAATPVAAAPAPKKSAPSSGSTARRSASSGTHTASAPAPVRQPRIETVKHTKRDAAIGAGVGAAAGAVIAGSGNRVKGAVIGGVVGGVVGGVIGNNVDKTTRVVY